MSELSMIRSSAQLPAKRVHAACVLLLKTLPDMRVKFKRTIMEQHRKGMFGNRRSDKAAWDYVPEHMKAAFRIYGNMHEDVARKLLPLARAAAESDGTVTVTDLDFQYIDAAYEAVS